MKIIKLTSFGMNKKSIYINVEHLGHFYEVPAKIVSGVVTTEKYTKVGVTTHNNGGFEVSETPEQILKLLK